MLFKLWNRPLLFLQKGRKPVDTVTVLYSEINILCMVIMTVIAIKSSVVGFGHSARVRLFRTSVWLAAAANGFDFLWNLNLRSQGPANASLMWCIDFLYFVSFGLSSYCWFIYTETRINKSILERKRTLLLLFVPIAVLIVLLITSYFNGCLFYFDDAGEYHRGSLFYLQQILSYGYICVSSVRCLTAIFKKENYEYRVDFLTLASFMVAPLICGVIQMIFQDVPVLSVGIVISFLLAYINFIESLISLDPLTGISNRRKLLQQLSDSLRNIKPDEKLYFLFIDVDNFKKINDSCGHVEGDRVLTDVAALLNRSARGMDCYVGRYGGDEFAVILTLKNAMSKDMCGRFIEGLHGNDITAGGKYKVTLSIGCTECAPSDSIQDIIARADEKMYEIKRHKSGDNGVS